MVAIFKNARRLIVKLDMHLQTRRLEVLLKIVQFVMWGVNPQVERYFHAWTKIVLQVTFHSPRVTLIQLSIAKSARSVNIH